MRLQNREEADEKRRRSNFTWRGVRDEESSRRVRERLRRKRTGVLLSTRVATRGMGRRT